MTLCEQSWKRHTMATMIAQDMLMVFRIDWWIIFDIFFSILLFGMTEQLSIHLQRGHPQRMHIVQQWRGEGGGGYIPPHICHWKSTSF